MAELVRWAGEDAAAGKGEVVILVAGAAAAEGASGADADRVLKALLAELPVKQAAALAAEITGLKKNQLYDRALELAGKK